jgi:type III pantothenate kinase
VLFALDIGNTNVVAGVFRPLPKAGRGTLAKTWRFTSDRAKTGDEYLAQIKTLFDQAGLKPAKVRGVVIASVVPPLTPVFEQVAHELFSCKPLVVSSKLDLGLKVLTDNPSEVGVDRLANAVSGFAIYGGPLVVVDFGTATKFDAVSAEGNYLGGAILPGVGISLEALVSRTAKLPRIEMAPPASAIGRNTLESMRSGIYYGTLGQIKEITRRLFKELGGRPKLVATGGLSHQWLPAKELGILAVDPDLTLEGLRLIFLKNQPKKEGKK